MKQKLLLALLALFTSMGMVKAADPASGLKIVVAKGGSATVNFGKSITYNAGNGDKTGSSYSLSSTETNGAGQTVDIDWKSATDLSISISGSNVTAITSYGNAVASFSVGSVGLETLNISSLTSLNKLTIGTNKLSSVPEKGSLTTYSIEAQSPDGLTGIAEINAVAANKPLDITLSKLGVLTGGTTFTLEGWKIKSGTSYISTSAPHTDASAPLRYYFFNGGSSTSAYQDGYEYINGDFTCDVRFASNDSKYPNVIIKNVPVKVLAAEYTMNKPVISPSDKGSLAVLDGNTPKFTGDTETVKKGDKFTLQPAPTAGYSFSDFEAKGLTITKNDNNDLYTAEVNGKATPSLKAIFAADGQVITISEPSNGVLEVFNGSTKINSGDKVATGKALTIKATPNSGYEVDNVQVNGEKQTATNNNDVVKSYTYTVSSEKLIITASFKVKTNSELALKWKKLANDDNDKPISKIFLNGTEKPGSNDGSTGYRKVTENVAYNSKPTISIQTEAGYYVSSILVNNTKIPYETISKGDKTSGPKYLISNFSMPNGATTMVIGISEKSDAKIIVTSTGDNSSGFEYSAEPTYDGTMKSIPYSTNPSNLSNVSVKYNTNNDPNNAYWSTSGYMDAGTYYARYARTSDEVYKDATVVNSTANDASTITDGIVKFVIKAATATITAEPIVTIDTKDGTYKCSGGTVQYARGGSMVTIDSKKYVWEVVKENGTELADPSTDKDSNGKFLSKVVKVRLHLKKNVNEAWADDNKDTNFQDAAYINVKAKGEVDNIKSVNVEILTSKLPEGTTLTMMNGDKPLGTKASVLVGTKISFQYTAASGTAEIYQVDVNGNKVPSATNLLNNEIEATGEKMLFCLFGAKGANLDELVLISAKDESGHEYNGKAQLFDTANSHIRVKSKKTGNEITTSVTWLDAIITYKEDATGKETTAPVNAGTYTVAIVRPADKDYKEFTATGSMIIQQATPEVVTNPTSAWIGKGQKLSTAVLTGGVANVKGTFEWVSPNTIVNTTGSYSVKFVSQDSNYKDLALSNPIEVTVTTDAILSIAEEDSYKITVKGSDGKAYTNGMTVPVGTELTFTVTPAASYKLKAIYVNGTAITGDTYKATAGPISVKAEMTQEFTITSTASVKGVVITLPTSNKVKAGESYVITLAHLASDKPVVKDGTTEIAGVDGKYTISNIQSDKSITITLATPTAIEMKSDTTLSAGKKEMGKIAIAGLTDGKCYYGDKITATATPVSGAKFAGWVGQTSTDNPLTLTVTKGMTLKAIYTGSPVGIEDVDAIDGVQVYGGKGYIFVGCEGEAILTIVSMNGQSTKTQVSGETRIDTAAGIYGIVLEQGTKVMRTKIAVK